MVYKIKKEQFFWSATNKDGEEQIFTTYEALLEFLAGWAVKDMRVGEEKLVTDVEIANAMV